MKETKRALRRHHRQRMIARALKMSHLFNVSEENRRHWALRVYKNRQKCSCSMCGHRRKWHGLPVQEQRQLYAAEFELQNLFCAEINKTGLYIDFTFKTL